jgi:CubicO group peptidase (beta-lactamase class C family)
MAPSTPRLRSVAAALVALSCAVAVVNASADPSVVRALLEGFVNNDPTVLGASVSAVDDTGLRMDAAASAGYSRTDLAQRMAPNIAVRAGTLGELLLAAVVVQLQQESILPQADETIPARLLPGGLIFFNPNFPGQPLSIRMLLTHTSSLQDPLRFEQNPALVASGSTAQSLQTFGNDFFTTTSTGTRSVRSDIWSSAQPGLTASYRYARVNIALLAYVVQLAMADNTQLATVPTVGALIQERILARLGMTSTYFMLPDGRAPFVQAGLANLASTKQVEPSTFQIHAAYVADYMCLTSSADLVKLGNALFVQRTGALRVIGVTMLQSFRTLSVVDTNRGNMREQGFGIVSFDTTHLCNVWRASGGSSLTCPFVSTRRVYGYTASSEAATVALLCQDAPLTTTTAAPSSTPVVCTSAAFTRRASSPARVSIDRALAAAAEAHNQQQSQTLNSRAGVVIVRPVDQTRDVSYGLTVFVLVVLAIFFVIILSYIIEFIVRPIAVTGPVVAHAYPKLDDVMMDDEDEASPLRLGGNN